MQTFKCEILCVAGCSFPGAPAHSTVRFSDENLTVGSVATYSCERGFELLGPSRRICTSPGVWHPEGIPFCGESIRIVHAIIILRGRNNWRFKKKKRKLLYSHSTQASLEETMVLATSAGRHLLLRPKIVLVLQDVLHLIRCM
ncbi:hypothetical protein AAG570_004571 [Ranatra chinensis]|uniref:Sushi domain-containing protein n=1 Tax=Ranatra chinensis TaxID=642074 RepID=A0ABD0YPT4_9HEMI